MSTLQPLSPRLRDIDAAVVERVEQGIALMKEKYGSDWAEEHSDEFLTTFDIKDGDRCVLGIVYGGYNSGLNVLHISDSGDYGFNVSRDYRPDGQEEWVQLQAAWTVKIAELVGADPDEIEQPEWYYHYAKVHKTP